MHEILCTTSSRVTAAEQWAERLRGREARPASSIDGLPLIQRSPAQRHKREKT
jgi:hypothetical protein